MLTNDEIRGLVDEAKADIAFCEEHIESLPMYDFKMTTRLTSAIETLLARQADAIRDLKNRHTLSRDDNVNVALWNALDAMRAILDPPLAEEKTNG